MHLAVFFWGFTGILGKLISLSAPVLVWYRMGFTALFIAVIIQYRKQWQKIVGRDMWRIIGIGLLFAIHWVMFYAAIKLANSSIALICLSTASVFTALIDPLVNKRKINLIEIALSIIAIVGVYLIYALQGEKEQQKMVNFPLGLLLAVLAAIISAIFTVFNKPLTNKYEPRLLVFYEMLTGFVFLSVLAPMYLFKFPEEPLLAKDWDILWVFCLVYFCTVLGQSLAMSALKHLSTFTVTFTVNLEPLYGIAFAFILFNEHKELGWGFYAGVACIALSVLLQTFFMIRSSKRAKAALAAVPPQD
jgi:drug/metabolite transporter (DMT)-like permease